MITTRSRRTRDEADGARSAHAPSAVPAPERPASPPSASLGDARRRQRVLCALAIAAAVGLTAALAASFSPPPTKATSLGSRRRPPAQQPVRPRVTRTAAGLLSWHGPMRSPRVFDTSLGLYFAWSTTPLGAGSLHGVLARVDQVTGEMSVVRATQGRPRARWTCTARSSSCSRRRPPRCLVDPSHAWTRPR